MAANSARPIPQKNTAFRLTFPIRKNDGTLITGAAGIAAKYSIDGGTFATCNGSPGEIAAASGVYYLDLLAAEMNGDTVAVLVTSTSTGAVPVVVVLYPQSAPDQIPVDAQWLASSGAAAVAQADLARLAVKFNVDTATFAATTTDFETSLTASVATDFYKGRSVVFFSGALTNQATRILGSTYTGNGKVKLTVPALTAAPANNVTAYIV